MEPSEKAKFEPRSKLAQLDQFRIKLKEDMRQQSSNLNLQIPQNNLALHPIATPPGVDHKTFSQAYYEQLNLLQTPTNSVVRTPTNMDYTPTSLLTDFFQNNHNTFFS